MVLEDHRVPQVTFQLMIPGAGGYYDPADRGGLATWTAAMMREGTATRTSAQISEALETMGASLFTSGGTSSTNAEIDGSALTESLPQADGSHRGRAAASGVRAGGVGSVQGADEAAVHAASHEPGVPRQRDVQQGGVRHASGQPHLPERVGDRRGHARPISPSIYRTHYVPDHAVLAFAGDITLDAGEDARRRSTSATGRRPERRRRR